MLSKAADGRISSSCGRSYFIQWQSLCGGQYFIGRVVIYLEDQVYVKDSALWCRECFLVKSARQVNVFIPWTLFFFIAASASMGTAFLPGWLFFAVREYLCGGWCSLCNYTIQRRTQKLQKNQRWFIYLLSAKFMILDQLCQAAFQSWI